LGLVWLEKLSFERPYYETNDLQHIARENGIEFLLKKRGVEATILD
jgi:hypothetical protein